MTGHVQLEGTWDCERRTPLDVLGNLKEAKVATMFLFHGRLKEQGKHVWIRGHTAFAVKVP